jgi:hypothetical protein
MVTCFSAMDLFMRGIFLEGAALGIRLDAMGALWIIGLGAGGGSITTGG